MSGFIDLCRMAAIRNIIFDFGNVLFDIEMPRIREALQQYYGAHYTKAFEAIKAQGILELYEVGGVSTEEFVDFIRRAGGQPFLSEEQVVSAWNAIFIGMPRPRFDFLLQLRKEYKVFLLSNINNLHEQWIADYMVREHGIADYERTYFDGVYMSHLIRLRKPNTEIYEYVLADAELDPRETIFFDDLEENVAGARLTGIHGIWHEPGREIITHCQEFIAHGF